MRVGDGGTVLTLDAREAQYAAGDVQTLTPGVEQYFAGGRAWLTARWINVFDELGDHRSGYLARLDGYATDRLRLFAGFSDAADTSAGAVIDTKAVFGGVVLDVDEATTLRLSAARENRETGADRTEVSLGVGFAF